MRPLTPELFDDEDSKAVALQAHSAEERLRELLGREDTNEEDLCVAFDAHPGTEITSYVFDSFQGGLLAAEDNLTLEDLRVVRFDFPTGTSYTLHARNPETGFWERKSFERFMALLAYKLGSENETH